MNSSRTKLEIDLTKWTTQANKASYTIGVTTGRPVTVEYISKLIRLGKLRSLHIPELGITLVER